MKNQSNVIPFPKAQQPAPSAPNQTTPPPQKPVAKKKAKFNPSLASTVLSLFAIALAAGASNTSVFKKNEGWVDVASLAGENRGIASVDPSVSDIRDAAWEKSIAESLASAEVRDIASVQVGHEASLDEKVRFGVLERKYTILRDLKRNEVESIILQGSGSKPSFVMDRSQFLGQFGHWISDKYGAAELKSSETKEDRRFEAFTIFDKKHEAYATAKFELDNYQRLLSFHLEPLAE
jgi:hypothetical protein